MVSLFYCQYLMIVDWHVLIQALITHVFTIFLSREPSCAASSSRTNYLSQQNRSKNPQQSPRIWNIFTYEASGFQTNNQSRLKSPKGEPSPSSPSQQLGVLEFTTQRKMWWESRDQAWQWQRWLMIYPPFFSMSAWSFVIWMSSTQLLSPSYAIFGIKGHSLLS